MDASASESARKKRVFHPKGAGAAGRMFRSAMDDVARSAIRLKRSQNEKNTCYIRDEKRKQQEILRKKKDLIDILDDITIEKKLKQDQSESNPLKICSSLSASEAGSICPPISPNLRIKSWLNANKQYVDDEIELSSSVGPDLEESKSIQRSSDEDLLHNINSTLSIVNQSKLNEKPKTESSNSFNLDKFQTKSASTVINAFFHETTQAKNSSRPSTYEKLHLHGQTLLSETDLTTSTVNSDKIRNGGANVLKRSSQNTLCSTDISIQGSNYNIFDKTQIMKHKSALSICSDSTQKSSSAVTASSMSIDSGYLSIKSPTHQSTTDIYDNVLGKESMFKCFRQDMLHGINSNASSLDSLDCDYQPPSAPVQNFAHNSHERTYKTQDVMQNEVNYFGQSTERRPRYNKQDSGYDTYNECYSVDNLPIHNIDDVSLTKQFDHNFFLPPPLSRASTSNVTNFDTTSDSFECMMQEFKATKLCASTDNGESINFNPFLDQNIHISDKILSGVTTTNKILNSNEFELKHEKNEFDGSTFHHNFETSGNYLECSAENLNLISKLIDTENPIPESSGAIFPDEVMSNILSNDDSFIRYERQRVLNYADKFLDNFLQNDTYFENSEKIDNSIECVENNCLTSSKPIEKKTKHEENALFCGASISELCEVSIPMDHFLDGNVQKDIHVENVELDNAKENPNVDTSLLSMPNVPEFDKQLISNLCDFFLDDSKCLLP